MPPHNPVTNPQAPRQRRGQGTHQPCHASMAGQGSGTADPRCVFFLEPYQRPTRLSVESGRLLLSRVRTGKDAIDPSTGLPPALESAWVQHLCRRSRQLGPGLPCLTPAGRAGFIELRRHHQRFGFAGFDIGMASLALDHGILAARVVCDVAAASHPPLGRAGRHASLRRNLILRNPSTGPSARRCNCRCTTGPSTGCCRRSTSPRSRRSRCHS